MPIGNGRTGSLVWTTPDALHFQINRCDVFAENASSVSFPQADSDYASGCGYVDLNVAATGPSVFTGSDFHQHLDVRQALLTTRGTGLTTQVVAWPERDVIAVEVEDTRAEPETINLDLRMLRYAVQRITGRNYPLVAQHTVEIHTAEHTATSQLHLRDGRIALTQQFRERDFYDTSAVAISVVGRPSHARYLNESTVQLSVTAGRGRFTVLIASAASADPAVDVAALACNELAAAEPLGFAALAARTRAWWSSFWARGAVRLHSADGQADLVGAHYTYFLYLMGASSRGDFPPRFGGMLWRTTGDLSRWGSQYWWANTSAYYQNLMPANRLELMDPLFTMYFNMRDSAALAARQQWGAGGIWIPEITFFDGLEALPENIASELRELMLGHKPFAERSTAFQAFAEVRNRHHARWNFQADGRWVDGHFVVPDKGHGIFGHCTHIMGVATRVAALCWQRYQYTADDTWLRERAYPMLRGAAEFYRTFPNFVREADGRWHIHHVNNGEGQWDASDTVYELTCLNQIFPLVVRAAEILDVDAELRPLWREIAEHLVPAPPRDYAGLSTGFVYGAPDAPGAIAPLGPDPELKQRFLGFNRLTGFIDEAGIGGARIFRNRLRLREGPGAIDAEHLGALAGNLHTALLDSSPPTPAGDPILRLFNHWPRDWDAAFTLLARGAFLVRAHQTDGHIGPVEITALAGGTCHLQNPWGHSEVLLLRTDTPSSAVERLDGTDLSFPTRSGEHLTLRQP